ncbi:MAG: ribonuclease HI [Thermodesulfobacteriota bacterium]
MTDVSPNPPTRVEIYTDGSCLGNPGPGGWAAVLLHPKKKAELSGGFRLTTNNRMELYAAIEALRTLRFPCQVKMHTDSEYLKKGITLWIRAWKKNGWKTTEKKPVKNQDLWFELDRLLERHQVEWHWVRGHAGNRYNDLCDRLAVEAAKKKDLPPDPGFRGGYFPGSKNR